jgi:hypothetical protein
MLMALQDLTYSYYQDSLIFFFCYDSLRVKLSSHQEFNLKENNFIQIHQCEEDGFLHGDWNRSFLGMVVFIVAGYVLFDGIYGFEKKGGEISTSEESNLNDLLDSQKEHISSRSLAKVVEQGERCRSRQDKPPPYLATIPP